MLADHDARGFGLGPQGRMGAHGRDDLGHAHEQAAVIEPGLTHFDPVGGQLTRLTHQPGRMGERAHRDRAVIGRHAAKGAAGRQRRARSEVGGAGRRGHAGRTRPHHQHVDHAEPPSSGRSASQRRADRLGMKPYSPPRVTTKLARPWTRRGIGRRGIE